MNRALYEERKRYVESLNSALKPMQDFDSIHYGRVAITNEEIIKISDKIGGYVYIEVTGDSLENILKDVARIILDTEPDGSRIPRGLITDRQKLRELAPLFKETA